MLLLSQPKTRICIESGKSYLLHVVFNIVRIYAGWHALEEYESTFLDCAKESAKTWHQLVLIWWTAHSI